MLNAGVDMLSLVNAIKAGQPLPIFSSAMNAGISVSRMLGQVPSLQMQQGSTVLNAASAAMSLVEAIKQHDKLAAIQAGVQLYDAYQSFSTLQETGAMGSATAVTLPGASAPVPIVDLINFALHLRNKQYVDAGVDAVAIYLFSTGNSQAAVFVKLGYEFLKATDIIHTKLPVGLEVNAWWTPDAEHATVLSVEAHGPGDDEAKANLRRDVLDPIQQSVWSLIDQANKDQPSKLVDGVAVRTPGIRFDPRRDGLALLYNDSHSGEFQDFARYDGEGRRRWVDPSSLDYFDANINSDFFDRFYANEALAAIWDARQALLARQLYGTESRDARFFSNTIEYAAKVLQQEQGLGEPTSPQERGYQVLKPVAIDLDGDGIETIARANSQVVFDVNDHGFLERTAWIGPDDGMLALDMDLNGKIDSGRELFSLADANEALRGLPLLQYYDVNKDGRLDQNDPVFAYLKVWQDRNSNGVSEADELTNAADLLPHGINLLAQSVELRNVAGAHTIGSPVLDADLKGTRLATDSYGTFIEASDPDSDMTLLAGAISHAGDRSVLVKTYEDIGTHIPLREVLLQGLVASGISVDDLAHFVVTNATDIRHGNLTVSDGILSFDPQSDYAGPDAGFSIVVDDGNGAQTIRVSLEVAARDDATQVTNTFDNAAVLDWANLFSASESTSGESSSWIQSYVTSPIKGKLTLTDIDSDTTTMTVRVIDSGRSGGTISLNPQDLTWTWTPPASLSGNELWNHLSNIGQDAFLVEVIDAAGNKSRHPIPFSPTNDPIAGAAWTMSKLKLDQLTRTHNRVVGTGNVTWNVSRIPPVPTRPASSPTPVLPPANENPPVGPTPEQLKDYLLHTNGIGASGGIGLGVAYSAAIAAAPPPPRDPLALDLDGDGIETIGITPQKTVLFDHDGDGNKAATGWLAPDDGWLVRDRNGNGTIDNGGELFGVDTVLSNGSKATDGFAALCELDSNGDGLLTAADTQFSQLKVWQDVNQDGISQVNELQTLAQRHIVSIAVGGKAGTVNLGNGNVQTALGTYIRDDGTEGKADTGAELAAANLNLATDAFLSDFSQHVAPNANNAGLPEMLGSGQVRNLSEAVALSTKLTSKVRDFLEFVDRRDQLAVLDDLLEAWADTSAMKSLLGQAKALQAAGNKVAVNYTFTGVQAGSGTYAELVRRIGVIERFTGVTFAGPSGQASTAVLNATSGTLNVAFSGRQIDSLNETYDRLRVDTYESLGIYGRLSKYSSLIFKRMDGDLLVYDFSRFETGFQQVLKEKGKEGAIDFVEFLSAYGTVNLFIQGWDYREFVKRNQDVFSKISSADLEKIRGSGFSGVFGTSTSDALSGSDVSDFLFAGAGNDTLNGMRGDDVLFGGDGADNVQGGEGHDELYGGEGDDTLSGQVGDDALIGGKGNDTLYGDAGNDTLDGGTGNDYLSGGTGADVYLFGRGSGQDTIYNYDGDAVGTNADTILLGADLTAGNVTLTRSSDDLIISLNGTDDSLRVQSYFNADGTASYVVENLKFADGTVWDVATIKSKLLTPTAGNDILFGYATNDTIGGGDGNDTVYSYAGDDVLDGGTGRDNLQGGDGNDTVKGGTGNDTLYGGNGNDSLLGNEHNDTLYGDAGNDTLDGGTGNDYLSGGTGADVYLFGRGSGQDTIYNYDGDAVGTNADTILLGADLTAGNVTLTRSSDDLIISLNGTDDSLRVQSYFNADGTASYVVENLKFADGTVWGYATVKANLSTVTPPASVTMNGTAANETLIGGRGNDSLYGGAGSDTLDGGAGNDMLDGGAGNDTYLFGRSAGKDTISGYDSTAGKLDTIQLGSDVLTSDVTLTRDGDSLVLSINGSSDALRVANYFTNDATYGYQVEQIKFADGTIWDISTVKTKVATATNENDMLFGYASADILPGLAGDDTVYARAGNDTLDGGAGEDRLFGEDGDDLIRGGMQNDFQDGGNGNDTLQGQDGDDSLYGGAGSDTLDGGAGNDMLDGGAGNDTYLFGKGYNSDTISTYDSSGTDNDRVVIGGDISEGLIWFQRTGNDLQLSLIDSNDKLTVRNWYSGSAYHVDGFDLGNGKHLLESQVDALVSAMAAFAPPAAGQTSLPADYLTALNPVIAASWK